MRRPAAAVASSYGSWGAGSRVPALLQQVDLVTALRERGLPQDAALAFLDCCPALALEASCSRAGLVHSGRGGMAA